MFFTKFPPHFYLWKVTKLHSDVWKMRVLGQKELGGGAPKAPPPACLGLRVPELCSDNKQTDKQR